MQIPFFSGHKKVLAGFARLSLIITNWHKKTANEIAGGKKHI
jgi:hypothetical protein